MIDSQVYTLILILTFILCFLLATFEEIRDSRIYRKARIQSLRNYRINKEKDDKESFLNELRRK